MISQEDIIRTLVNKNCTNESILSTALSPDCTPSKLLDKFTEAERFDLALDVSMKLGRDVLPLWKTWAILCLKNRNFQGAREKFRHCFLRLRSASGRMSSLSSGLLEDILKELSRMDELKLALVNEIEIIKQRKHHLLRNQQVPSGDNSIKSTIHKPFGDQSELSKRPQIFAECLYYLNEYGYSEDKIKFYIKNSLWSNATEILLSERDKINEEKFFITDVFLYLTYTGRLNEFLQIFLAADPELITSHRYFKAIYDFCTVHRRYNLLYYVQSTIGDYIAAAKNQINHFFLKKPAQSYKELNNRLSSLYEARKNFQIYLEKAEKQQATDKSIPELNDCKQIETSLLSQMDLNELKTQLQTIEFQINITRNFAINEVSGCMNGTEIAGNDETKRKAKSSSFKVTIPNESIDFPVTLFDKSYERSIYLAALVLIYFDMDCDTNFSKSGLDLVNKLIDSFGLDKLSVFKTAMHLITEDESCDILENTRLMIELLKEDYLTNVRPKLIAEKKKTLNIQRNANQNRLIKGDKSSSTTLSPTSTVSHISSSKTSLPPSKSNLNSTNERTVPKNAKKPVVKVAVATSSEENLLPLASYRPITSKSRNANEAARAICDEVIRDAIGYCREPDYKMELAKFLSAEAKIELYIELGKLSNAQALAFNMNRPDYVSLIIDEASKRNQNHVKTVCQLWLAKSS